jgi:rod shape-determining protein MreD
MSWIVSSGMQSETNVEVHKYYTGTVIGAALLALVLQAFFHKYGRWAELVELPLLVTIYFGLSHDNPIGLYGIAKTLVGYVASSVGARIDTEHPISRFGLIFALFHFHQFVLAVTQRALLGHSAPLINLHLFIASLISAALGVLLFTLLDRLRRPS